MQYLLYLPKEYERKEVWPLVLFLHGVGERGDDLELVKRHGMPKLIEACQEFPFVVVSPQCPDDTWWNPLHLTEVLDEVVGKCKVDEERIYVTGLSMGGFGTWALAAHTPERFAALAPICGGGNPIWAERLAHVPIWVFHGAKDDVVPIRRSEEMVEALEQKGGSVQFTVYPEAEHDAWTETYANDGLYEWLLEQKRETKR